MKRERIILAFGKRWDRCLSEKYNFKDIPKRIEGRSSGAYILFNRKRTVYIGKSIKSLRRRIREHTHDHLKKKWNCFSWFITRKRYTSELEALMDSIFWKIQDVTFVKQIAQLKGARRIQEDEIKKLQKK